MINRLNSIEIIKNFEAQTKAEAQMTMSNELNKLLYSVEDPVRNELIKQQLDSFFNLFKRYLAESGREIDFSKISMISDDKIKFYDKLDDPVESDIKKYITSLAVIKLNGGLGTRMGCTFPKSLISVRSDLTFLDFTIRQIEHLNETYHCDVPLVLMNSWNTHEETKKVLQKYNKINVKIYTFVQSMYPRIDKESLLPFCKNSYDENNVNNSKNNEAWYPPGHGDIYRSLAHSGILEQLIEQGKKWIFVSNIDNMGANVDTKILNYLMKSERSDGMVPDFVMEVTEKTNSDVQGGILLNYENRLRLLEKAQVPKIQLHEFRSIHRSDIFNTNNLWINLQALHEIIMNDSLEMEVIINPKTLANGTNIIQLEEASGSAIKSFKNGIGLRVPRGRFLPVKTTSDLLLIMSNLYIMKPDKLILSPKKNFAVVPVVKLGYHFKKVNEFLKRFENIPDILELHHLTVKGDVTFGKDVVLKGTIIIIAEEGEIINIPSGSVLEDQIISGKLRILNH